MVAYTLHSVGVATQAFGDFNYDFGVFFCGGRQVGQTAAGFEWDAGISLVFGF